MTRNFTEEAEKSIKHLLLVLKRAYENKNQKQIEPARQLLVNGIITTLTAAYAAGD